MRTPEQQELINQSVTRSALTRAAALEANSRALVRMLEDPATVEMLSWGLPDDPFFRKFGSKIEKTILHLHRTPEEAELSCRPDLCQPVLGFIQRTLQAFAGFPNLRQIMVYAFEGQGAASKGLAWSLLICGVRYPGIMPVMFCEMAILAKELSDTLPEAEKSLLKEVQDFEVGDERLRGLLVGLRSFMQAPDQQQWRDVFSPYIEAIDKKIPPPSPRGARKITPP
ncbi:MAG: hypothetical protein M3O22_02615 [Pseudomonadota bacterium]|nr:hypothetical protein [Pseudomonadota bacterium]